MSLARFRQRQACGFLTVRHINIKSTQTFCIGKRSWFPFFGNHEFTGLLTCLQIATNKIGIDVTYFYYWKQ